MNIDDAFDKLGSIQPAETPPFLHTRIRARIEGLAKHAPREWKWAFAGAGLVVLILNMTVLFGAGTTPQTNMQEVVQDMHLNSSNQLYHE